jgi:hypothetical protein
MQDDIIMEQQFKFQQQQEELKQQQQHITVPGEKNGGENTAS